VPVFVFCSPIAAKKAAMWFRKRDRWSWKYEIRMITRHIAASLIPWRRSSLRCHPAGIVGDGAERQALIVSAQLCQFSVPGTPTDDGSGRAAGISCDCCGEDCHAEVPAG
jgi:hypothetical protein